MSKDSQNSFQNCLAPDNLQPIYANCLFFGNNSKKVYRNWLLQTKVGPIGNKFPPILDKLSVVGQVTVQKSSQLDNSNRLIEIASAESDGENNFPLLIDTPIVPVQTIFNKFRPLSLIDTESIDIGSIESMKPIIAPENSVEFIPDVASITTMDQSGILSEVTSSTTSQTSVICYSKQKKFRQGEVKEGESRDNGPTLGILKKPIRKKKDTVTFIQNLAKKIQLVKRYAAQLMKISRKKFETNHLVTKRKLQQKVIHQSVNFREITKNHPCYYRVQQLRKDGPSHKLYVRKSKIHRNGLFTESVIQNDEIIIEYIGEVISKVEQERREETGLDTYCAAYTGNKVIDGTYEGNISKYANHSCNPNCALELLCFNKTNAIVLTSLRDIVPGDEITFDYQFEDEANRKELTLCQCGSDNCRTFINLIKNPSKKKMYSKPQVDYTASNEIFSIKTIGSDEKVKEWIDRNF